MRRRDFITLVGGTVVFPFATSAQQPQPIDETLRGAVERKEIAGVVAMAADRNRVIYQGAFGMADIADSRPLKLDALFRIASMTKPITAVAAMQLVERDRLALDDPAEKYFLEFAKLSVLESLDAATGAYKLRPATKPVTVRHLFTHTSGLGYRFTSPTLRDFKPRAGDPVRPLLFEPGEQWMYGPSTDWLGRLVEKISGLSLDEYFRRRIFVPLQDVRHVLRRAAGQAGAPRHGLSSPGRRLAGEAARAAASNGFQTRRRRRPVVDRQRLHPLHPHAAQRRRARRRPNSIGQLGRRDGAESDRRRRGTRAAVRVSRLSAAISPSSPMAATNGVSAS